MALFPGYNMSLWNCERLCPWPVLELIWFGPNPHEWVESCYNLEIENYMDKYWSTNLWFKLRGYVTRCEGVRHPPYLVKLVF